MNANGITNISERVFNALHKAVQEEIDFLYQNGILNQHQSEMRSGYVLNRILQEHTLRYIMIKKFYELLSNKPIKFDTEVNGIDVVFYQNEKKYAFEIKRWQTNKEKDEIKRNDIPKLRGFFEKDKNNTLCYELIYSINDPGKSKDDYIKYFDEFNDSLERLNCEVIPKDGLTYCIYIAELKRI